MKWVRCLEIHVMLLAENSKSTTFPQQSLVNRTCKFSEVVWWTIVNPNALEPDALEPDALEPDALDNIGDGVDTNINHGVTEVTLLDYIYITIHGMAGLPMGEYRMHPSQTAGCTVGVDHNAYNHGVQSITPDPKTTVTTPKTSRTK